MKLLVIIISPHQLQELKQALNQEDIYSMTVSNVLGCSRVDKYIERYRGVTKEVSLIKQIKVEVALNESFVERAIDAIINAVRTGSSGDGKIFVYELAQCIRIQDLERGPKAV